MAAAVAVTPISSYLQPAYECTGLSVLHCTVHDCSSVSPPARLVDCFTVAAQL